MEVGRGWALAALLLAACSDGHEPDAAEDDEEETADGSSGRGRGGSGSTASGRDGGTEESSDASAARDGGGGPGMKPLVQGGDAGSCAESQSCEDAAKPSPTVCTTTTLAQVDAGGESGNVLLVFDRSASMTESWNGMPRWEAAGTAVKEALTPWMDRLTVGALFFPSPDPNGMPVCIDPTGVACLFTPGLTQVPGSCGVSSITAADQIAFRSGTEFLTVFAGTAGSAPPYAPVPAGLTPLLEALQKAKADLAAAALGGTTSVVVITDGDPNCQWDAAAAKAIVAQWHADGVDTHVIGLPGATTASSSVLADLASASETTVVSAADAPALQSSLRSALAGNVGGALDCAIALDIEPTAGAEVHVFVTLDGERYDAAQDMGGGSGWTLAANATLQLTGALCAAAQDRRYQAVEAVAVGAGCVVGLPPLPPP